MRIEIRDDLIDLFANSDDLAKLTTLVNGAVYIGLTNMAENTPHHFTPSEKFKLLTIGLDISNSVIEGLDF